MEKYQKGSWPSTLMRAAQSINRSALSAVLALSLTLLSCSDRSHQPFKPDDGKVPLTISVGSISQADFSGTLTKAKVNVGEICSILNFAIYTDTGDKVEKIQINQEAGEESFGTVSTELTVGMHRIVVIAHGGDKNPTMTDPNSITFNNTAGLKTTDVFCWSSEIEVTSQTGVVEVSLERVTAMFRLVLTDESIPEGVAEMRFKYSGGSAALNPFTGEGTVKSNQTETIAVRTGQKRYEVYTIPRFEEKDGQRQPSMLKMTIEALDVSGNTVKSRVIENIPVTRNRITCCTGEYFEGGIMEYTTLAFQGLDVEEDWAGTDDIPLNR